MKIYEIGTGYTPIPAQVAAATESIAEELTKAFLAMGQPVEIIDISAPDRAAHRLPITEVKVPSVFSRSDVSLGLVHKLKRVVYSVALARRLKKLLKRSEEKAVLHFHNQYNLFFFLKLVPKKLRKKAVTAYTNHNGVWNLPWSDAEGVLKKRYFQEIRSMKEADAVFVLNQRTKENIRAHLGVADGRIFEICNGVNVELYRPLPREEREAIKERYGLAGKRVILQVGSVNENKGQLRALKLLESLLREHEDLVFAYAGEIVSREYFDQVQACAQALGLADRVRYLGAVSPGEEMNALYNLSCATVCTSHYESFSLVTIESLAAGVPVIWCPASPLAFGEGVFVCGEAEFASCVSRSILSGDADASNGRAARETAVNRYAWEKVAEQYVLAFRRAEENA